jgi:hypothetical protein
MEFFPSVHRFKCNSSLPKHRQSMSRLSATVVWFDLSNLPNAAEAMQRNSSMLVTIIHRFQARHAFLPANEFLGAWGRSEKISLKSRNDFSCIKCELIKDIHGSTC